VIELCHTLALQVSEVGGTVEKLRAAEGVFLTLSTWGIIEVGELDGQPLSRSPIVARLRAAYEARLEAETAPR
jgi:branched-subunit amino acid aminotransferase/4-amino-4-deoxychorismate lyase